MYPEENREAIIGFITIDPSADASLATSAQVSLNLLWKVLAVIPCRRQSSYLCGGTDGFVKYLLK